MIVYKQEHFNEREEAYTRYLPVEVKQIRLNSIEVGIGPISALPISTFQLVLTDL